MLFYVLFLKRVLILIGLTTILCKYHILHHYRHITDIYDSATLHKTTRNYDRITVLQDYVNWRFIWCY